MIRNKMFDFLFLSIFFCFIFEILSPLAWGQSGEIKGAQYGSPESFAEFHGFVNLQYYDFDNQLPAGVPSGFDLRDFYLSARSKIRQNVTVFGEIDAEQGVFKLDRALIDLQLHPLVNFQFGKFFTPFGIDKVESTQAPLNKLSSIPLPLVELGYEDWADVGVQMYGEYGMKPVKLGYHLAVLKGPSGFTETDIRNKENNRNKFLTARGVIRSPLTGEGRFEAGASAAYGKYDDASQNTIKMIGADGKLLWSGLEIRGEYMIRQGNDSTAAVSCDGTNIAGPGNCTIARADASGYYLQISYALLKNIPSVYLLEPVVRIDKSDLADHFAPPDPDTARRRVTVGINYAPYAHFLLKGEYEFVKNDGTDLHNDGVLLSVVTDF
ncbi:MAG: hypothetical protein HY036_07965 [Nitrospirae bacterium]|nr:hypothetical protein [Nitrospirota bacterium]MBI3352500.1 hypothetical protein [Nitrospirota bacterium]